MSDIPGLIMASCFAFVVACAVISPSVYTLAALVAVFAIDIVSGGPGGKE
jgi:hypothetical protein